MKTLINILFIVLPLMSCAQWRVKPIPGKPTPERIDIADKNHAALKKRFEEKTERDSIAKVFLQEEIKELRDSLNAFNELVYEPPLYAIPVYGLNGKVSRYRIVWSSTNPDTSITRLSIQKRKK